MTGRQWFRKDVLIPLLFLILPGYGICWVRQQMIKQPELMDNRLFYYAWIISLIIYIILVFITIKHAAASYSLERFNPGNPQSLKRLKKLRRFHLKKALKIRLRDWAAPSEDLTQWLSSLGYQATARTPHGRVFEKKRNFTLFKKIKPVDRVFIFKHNLLNVIIIDQLLKDSIRYIKQQTDNPSPRNLLILIMDRDDENEAVSAAAGVVNFLGKFNGGTLGVFLLDLKFGKLYYPIDRSLQPSNHRRFQDFLRIKLLRWLAETSPKVRLSRESIETASYEKSKIRSINVDNIENTEPFDSEKLSKAVPLTPKTEGDIVRKTNDDNVDGASSNQFEED